MSSKDILLCRSILIFIICDLIYAPISIYYSYQYYKHRDEIIIKKRYGQVTLYEVLFSICKLFQCGIVYLCNYALNFRGQTSIMIGIGFCLTVGFDYCIFTRFWLLYYDIQLTVATANNTWKQLINPNFIGSKYNFFIKHKKTFGNYTWFKNHIILPLMTISWISYSVSSFYVGIKYFNDPPSIWGSIYS
eukprot:310720_1